MNQPHLKPRIRFVHGKKAKGFFCTWCDAWRDGRIVRETYRWRVIYECGHVSAAKGYTLPPSELERKGFINVKGSEDPRYTALKRSKVRDFFAKKAEQRRKEYLIEHSTSPNQFQ